jgi:hypothetical protein
MKPMSFSLGAKKQSTRRSQKRIFLFVVEQQVRPFYMVEGYADAKTSGSFGVAPAGSELKGGNQLWTVVN